jgi:hypothetical protein
MKGKWIGLLAIALSLITGTAAADEQDVLVSASVAFADADYRINGVNYDGDIDLLVVSSRFYVTDNLYATASSSSGDGSISNVSFDTSGFSLGGGVVLLDRVDYIEGTGSELRLGLEYDDTEVTVGDTSSDSTSSDIQLGYAVGLGSGISTFALYSTDTDEVGDSYGFSVGLYKSIADHWLLGAAYEYGESDLSGADTAEVSGIYLGVGYAF